MGAAVAAVASGPWVRGVLAQVEDEDIFSTPRGILS